MRNFENILLPFMFKEIFQELLLLTTSMTCLMKGPVLNDLDTYAPESQQWWRHWLFVMTPSATSMKMQGELQLNAICWSQTHMLEKHHGCVSFIKDGCLRSWLLKHWMTLHSICHLVEMRIVVRTRLWGRNTLCFRGDCNLIVFKSTANVLSSLLHQSQTQQSFAMEVSYVSIATWSHRHYCLNRSFGILFIDQIDI